VEEEEYTLLLWGTREGDTTEFADVVSCSEHTLFGSSCVVRETPLKPSGCGHCRLRHSDGFSAHRSARCTQLVLHHDRISSRFCGLSDGVVIRMQLS